jgi:hypothetical protein
VKEKQWEVRVKDAQLIKEMRFFDETGALRFNVNVNHEKYDRIIRNIKNKNFDEYKEVVNLII